jgi:hypothetical protein
MRVSIRTLDIALGVWVVVWLIAAAAVASSIKQLEDGGAAVVTAGDGLQETSAGLQRAAGGLHETADALGAIDELPFVPGDPGAAVERTAGDVERFAVRVRVTADDARAAGRDAEESARTLAVVLGLALALVPTVPVIALYLLLRQVIAEELART